MSKPKLTRWFNRSEFPARHGFYECAVRIAGGMGHGIWPEKLWWDGTGFHCKIPTVVLQWRGLAEESK